MKIGFLASDKPREQLLADAFLMGARRHGHETVVEPLRPEPFVGAYDVACMVGVKSRELWNMHKSAGVPVIYLDKGYCRQKRPDGRAGWEYWRVSINDHHPTARLGREMPDSRARALRLEFAPYRTAGDQIVIAGSSAKYHDFYGLREPTGYAQRIVQDLRKNFLNERPIIYRPKPSWQQAAPVHKTRFSGPDQTIGQALAGAWAMVTHGSNAAFEAMLLGVPVIVLGNAIALPISSTKLAEIEAPRIATDAERWRLMTSLAWWQWTEEEMADGRCWDFLGAEIHRQP